MLIIWYKEKSQNLIIQNGKQIVHHQFQIVEMSERVFGISIFSILLDYEIDFFLNHFN